jgi:aldehyde dehydrogenase (NAD+)
MKCVQLELGGKNAAIVFPDGNIQVAVEWCIRGFTLMSGQICIATSGLFVHKSIRDQFLEALKYGLKQLEAVTGDPREDNVFFGPLVDSAQFERVKSFIESGKKGSTLVYSGEQIGSKVSIPAAKVHDPQSHDSNMRSTGLFCKANHIRQLWN